MKRNQPPLLEDGDEGGAGRDPRTVSRSELEHAGFDPGMSPMRLIRAKCLDCTHTAQEVRLYGGEDEA